MQRKEKPILGTNLAGKTTECESYVKTVATMIMKQALVEPYVKSGNGSSYPSTQRQYRRLTLSICSLLSIVDATCSGLTRPSSGRVRPKHVVSTNYKKVNDLVTLVDNKGQILSVKRM
jgi:hypothetical protein